MDRFVNNLVGTFALAVSDAMAEAVTSVSGHGGALGAAVVYLDQEPGCGIEDLRAPLQLSQPAVVRLVTQLVDEGLATRTGDAEDRRRVRVRLTPRGEALAHDLLRARREAVAGVVAPLSEAEQGRLAGLVAKLFSGASLGRAEAERVCRLCDVRACPERRCPVEAAAASHVRPSR